MDINNSQVKVLFYLQPDEDGYPPVDSESLWAIPLGDDKYQIDNIPFYISGVSSNDVVTATCDASGALVFGKVAARRGHSTIRVLLNDANDATELREGLSALGCESEQDCVPQLIAVDVPPDANIDDVWLLLQRRIEQERLDYEDACIQHRKE